MLLPPDFTIPKSDLIRGMQSNMFKIRISRGAAGDVISIIGKRIVPEELPEKPSPEVWRDFVVSVKQEIAFYQMLLELEEANDVKGLFPKVYYSAGKDVR